MDASWQVEKLLPSSCQGNYFTIDLDAFLLDDAVPTRDIHLSATVKPRTNLEFANASESRKCCYGPQSSYGKAPELAGLTQLRAAPALPVSGNQSMHASSCMKKVKKQNHVFSFRALLSAFQAFRALVLPSFSPNLSK